MLEPTVASFSEHMFRLRPEFMLLEPVFSYDVITSQVVVMLPGFPDVRIGVESGPEAACRIIDELLGATSSRAR